MTDCYETREQREERKLREAMEALDNVVQFRGTWLTDEHAIALREYIAKSKATQEEWQGKYNDLVVEFEDYQREAE